MGVRFTPGRKKSRVFNSYGRDQNGRGRLNSPVGEPDGHGFTRLQSVRRLLIRPAIGWEAMRQGRQGGWLGN